MCKPNTHTHTRLDLDFVSNVERHCCHGSQTFAPVTIFIVDFSIFLM